jgi:hypothetical protein
MLVVAVARIPATLPVSAAGVTVTCPGAARPRSVGGTHLLEGYANPLIITPCNATRNARFVRLEEKVEALGNVLGIGNLQRGARN